MNEYQWLMLAKLIERFNCFKDSLELMEKMYPKCLRLKEIDKLFCKGNDIKDILTKDDFEKKVAYYCQFTSLNKSINIVCNRKKQLRQNSEKLLSDMVYQVILLISTIIVFELFYRLVLPTMANNLETEISEVNRLWLIFETVNTLKNIIVFGILIFLTFIIYMFFTKKLTHLWAFLHRLKADKPLKVLATYFLVSDLKILLENGISIHDALDAIRLNKNNQLSGLLAFHFNNSLESGVDFEESLNNEYFDDRFHSICLWGLKNDDFEKSLDDYIQIIELEIKNNLKKITRTSQITCYFIVSVIIVLAYEVLMIPLELLQEFDIFK